ncbi:helix-turn-helix domain-containing protein [Bdellovibrio sp. BCCA]|uniref:helix-turn-helix domain-containing protein n=1 Tax=Bdellovibrio sp. BCCA TaxID=3136281 RepID=UPI0030F143F1
MAQAAQPFITPRVKLNQRKERKYKRENSPCAVVRQGNIASDSDDAKKFSIKKVVISSVDNDQKFQHLGRPKNSPSLESESSLKTEEAEWLTSKEAADYLRISEGTLRNMASNGRVPYVKLGRSNRYSRSQLNQLLLSNKRGVLNGY